MRLYVVYRIDWTFFLSKSHFLAFSDGKVLVSCKFVQQKFSFFFKDLANKVIFESRNIPSTLYASDKNFVVKNCLRDQISSYALVICIVI